MCVHVQLQALSDLVCHTRSLNCTQANCTSTHLWKPLEMFKLYSNIDIIKNFCILHPPLLQYLLYGNAQHHQDASNETCCSWESPVGCQCSMLHVNTGSQASCSP